LALPLLIFAADTIVGAEVAGLLAKAVRSVETRGDLLRVAYRFEGDSVAVMKSRVKSAIRESAPLGDADLVRVYYERLADIGERDTSRWDGPVGRYLVPLFALARERSASADPVVENQAAILALAMYCGTLAFENLIGKVRKPSRHRRHWPRCRRNTLAGRHDLMLHFVYSAALKLAAESGLAFAVGEFKELLDSSRGGSGFSFADLAADRAGIRLAETALDSEAGARHVQAALAGAADESVYFPDISGLAEGLDEQAFRRDYRSLDDPAYRAAVDGLDDRISRLPAYRVK